LAKTGPPHLRHACPQGVSSADSSGAAIAEPEARRRRIGLEAAQILLGHRSAAVTEAYAETDEQGAIEAIMTVG